MYEVIGLVLLARATLFGVSPPDIAHIISDSSSKYQVPPGLIMAVIETESHYRSDAKNGKDVGLAQVRCITLKEVNRIYKTRYKCSDLRRNRVNIEVSALYLSYLKSRFKTWDLAVKAYNCGPSRVRRHHNRYRNKVLEKWKKIRRSLRLAKSTRDPHYKGLRGLPF